MDIPYCKCPKNPICRSASLKVDFEKPIEDMIGRIICYVTRHIENTQRGVLQPDALDKHPILVHHHLLFRPSQIAVAIQTGTATYRLYPERSGSQLDILQQRLDATDPKNPLGYTGPRWFAVQKLVSCKHESSELGRYLRIATPAQPQNTVSEVSDQTPVDLCPRDRPRLVGAGFPLHAATQSGIPGEASEYAGERSRNHP